MYRYNRTVFIAPPWKEIYEVDQERKQSFAEAVETCKLMVESYSGCGYHLLELPRVSPAERAEFVLQTLRLIPPD